MQRSLRAFGLGMMAVIAAGSALAEEAPEAQPVETAQLEESGPAPDASGSQASQPRDGARAEGRFSLTGEFLYLLPTLDDTHFVVKSPVTSTFPNGDRRANDLGHAPAFRLGVAYEFPETHRELALDYTFLDVSQKARAAGEFLWATVGRADFTSTFENYAGTASSDVDVNYQRVAARFTQPWSVSGIDFGFQFGFEYASIRESEEFQFVSGGTTGTVDQRARIWGIGPEVGVGIDYQILPDVIPGDLSIGLDTSLSALIAQSDTNANNAINGSSLLNVDDADASRLVPALHARVGLRYGYDFGPLGAALSLGYQLDSYFRAINRVSYVDDVGDSLSTTEYTNFDAQGMVLSATLTF